MTMRRRRQTSSMYSREARKGDETENEDGVEEIGGGKAEPTCEPRSER